jgi:hypothetical protein
MDSNVINNNSDISSGNLTQNNNYQYNIFSPYQTQNNFYNNLNVQAKENSSSTDYNGFDNNNYYYYQQQQQLKMNEQQNFNNNYQTGHYYSNYQPYFNNNYQTYDQQQSQVTAVEPVRTNTPDKPIMNDSGLGVSPDQLILNTLNIENQVIQESDEEDDIDSNDSNDDSSVENNHSVKKSSTKSNNNNDSSLMKPPKPYLEIIADAILTAQDHMMQLHEIYNYMESKYAYFAKNINKSWRNSVRHNLSLNECFIKAGRGSNGKGNYWKIHSACEPDFIRGNFRRKNFKILIRQNSSKNQQQQHQQPQKTQSLLETPNNPFNSLNYFNQQLQSFGIENFLNSNNLVNYNSPSISHRPTISNHRFMPY